MYGELDLAVKRVELQVGRAYGHFQMAHTPLFETISEAIPRHKLAEARGDLKVEIQGRDCTDFCSTCNHAWSAW